MIEVYNPDSNGLIFFGTQEGNIYSY